MTCGSKSCLWSLFLHSADSSWMHKSPKRVLKRHHLPRASPSFPQTFDGSAESNMKLFSSHDRSTHDILLPTAEVFKTKTYILEWIQYKVTLVSRNTCESGSRAIIIKMLCGMQMHNEMLEIETIADESYHLGEFPVYILECKITANLQV